ncbi:CshA/CshB family fibrillar adhesin-related protein [Bifidobacterium sp. ESL0745]|uniref:CshA/CshB family fibrillar adhesin-related protein n=1 Tax=Bifidobacterium sp. ESL0745 TaxID=2983226 RepID=UPI0023F900C3|nr:CshA/CshB family fibrillar adhesin-related protein [Bifidobacterium sp. ESL0745]MDF7665972.1 CshA/CshB family fibrillar adhesin-related protein [Bifidobacterium sp. ESL0745]
MAHGIFGEIAAIASAAAMALAGLAVAMPANATSATGGNGRMLPDINWVEWGNAGDQITGPKITWTSPVEMGTGHWLSTRCALAPAGDPSTAMSASLPIQAYRTGVYSGDALAQMYYEGGSGYANKMTAGLANVNNEETVSFSFSCAAYLIDSGASPTLDGSTVTSSFQPVPLQGLVFADAESNNWTRHQQEYIKATPSGGSPTWRLLDSYRTPGCNTNSIAELNGNTLRFRSDGPQCANWGGTGPSSVMFLQGSTGAQVTLRGGGVTAVALGSIIASDFGDAPVSYGAAGSLFQPSWQGGALGTDISGSPYIFPDPNDPDISMLGGTAFNLSAARDNASTNPNNVANFSQPTPRLGDHEDSEAEPHFSSGANWDDAHGDIGPDGHVINDEDGIAIPSDTKAINVTPDSTIYQLTVNCHGTGDVRGWIDWNHDGTFSPTQATFGGVNTNAEASNQVACSPSSNTATLNWQVPDDAQNQISANGNPSYLRLRITSDRGSNMMPTGLAGGDGEVEDYKADVHVPTLSVLTNIVGGRKDGTDQFDMIAQSLSSSASELTMTTSGNENGIQTAQIEPQSTFPGNQFEISSSLASGSASNPADYGQTVKCVDANNNDAPVNVDSSGVLTIPNNYDANVQCTFREKAFPDPALTMITVVHNRHGGTQAAQDFGFTAANTDNNPSHVYTFRNSAGGDSHVVVDGSYTVTPSALPHGYKQDGDITYVNDDTGVPVPMVDGKPQFSSNEHIIGTRVVEDLPSQLTLKTVVDNSEGGSARPSDFNFSVTLDGRDPVDRTVFNEGAQQTIDAGKYTIKGADLPAGYAQDGEISYTDNTTGNMITPVNEQIIIPNGDSVTGVRTVRSKPAKIEMITHIVGNGNATVADFPITITPTSGPARSLPDSTKVDVPASTYRITTDHSREPGYKVSRDLSCVVNDSDDVTITDFKATLPNDQSLVCEQTVAPQTDETLTFETNVSGNGDAKPSDFDVTITPSAGGGPSQTYQQGTAQVPSTTDFTVSGTSKPDYEQVGDIVYYLNTDTARAHPLTLAQAQQSLRNGLSVTGVRTVKGHRPKVTAKIDRDYRYGGTAAGDGSKVTLVPASGSGIDLTADQAKFVTSGTYSVRQLLNAGYKQSDLTVKLADGTPVAVNAANGTFAVSQDADVVVMLKNVDEPAELSFSRTDPNGNTLLSGSEWRLDGPDAQSLDVPDCTAETCTGPDRDPAAGKFEVTGLKWGKWTITETKAPVGYQLSPPFALTLGSGQDADGLSPFVAFHEGKPPVGPSHSGNSGSNGNSGNNSNSGGSGNSGANGGNTGNGSNGANGNTGNSSNGANNANGTNTNGTGVSNGGSGANAANGTNANANGANAANGTNATDNANPSNAAKGNGVLSASGSTVTLVAVTVVATLLLGLALSAAVRRYSHRQDNA